MTPVLGLVGGIGAGKSRVSQALARRGAVVVAGDPVGHEALKQPALRDRVIERFGREIIAADGEIDRRALGAIVFADDAARRDLEAIVFPWIGAELRRQLAAAKESPPVPLVVLDAAVMLEAGWHDACDFIVFIDAPREVRLARIRQQRGWTEADVAAREQAQWPLADKAAAANDTLDNSGSPADLERNLDALLTRHGLMQGHRRDGA